MTTPLASVIIATVNKPETLDKVLASVFSQTIVKDGSVEVVVTVDKLSDEPSQQVVEKYRDRFGGLVTLLVTNNDGTYRNPAFPRNIAARHAKSNVLIMQSDDVIHHTPDAIERLIDLAPGTVNIATVYNQMWDGSIGECYTGRERDKAYFFLGSCRREDFFTVGGNDEEFTRPGCDDDWLSACLGLGLGLTAVYREDIIGYHQDHLRPELHADYAAMRELLNRKLNAARTGTGRYEASGGPWPYTEGKSYDECSRL